MFLTCPSTREHSYSLQGSNGLLKSGRGADRRCSRRHTCRRRSRRSKVSAAVLTDNRRVLNSLPRKRGSSSLLIYELINAASERVRHNRDEAPEGGTGRLLRRALRPDDRGLTRQRPPRPMKREGRLSRRQLRSSAAQAARLVE